MIVLIIDNFSCFQKYINLLNSKGLYNVLSLRYILYFISSNSKTNSQKLLKIINNIVTTRSTNRFKINGVLDEFSKSVDENIYEIGNLINKKIVSIPDNLLKEIMNGANENSDKCYFGTVKNDLIFNKSNLRV